MIYPLVRYYASKKTKLVEIEHAPRNGVSTKETKHVSGKVEARRIARSLNGTCYNF